MKWLVTYNYLGWKRQVEVSAASTEEALRRGERSAQAVEGEGAPVRVLDAKLKGALRGLRS